MIMSITTAWWSSVVVVQIIVVMIMTRMRIHHYYYYGPPLNDWYGYDLIQNVILDCKERSKCSKVCKCRTTVFNHSLQLCGIHDTHSTIKQKQKQKQNQKDSIKIVYNI